MTETLRIEEWTSHHPRWHELLEVVESHQQADWVAAVHPWHRGSYVLVAHQGGVITGFLRFVTQVIGDDDELEPVTFDGAALLEAKVLAFAVVATQRRKGIGRALQEHALATAEQLGCYQVRSHSSGNNRANHHLKLAMGFGMHPIARGEDRRGAYFIMPLRVARRSTRGYHHATDRFRPTTAALHVPQRAPRAPR